MALEMLQASSIGSLTISNHAPVMATLALKPDVCRAWSWQLNESLLDDAAVVSGVTNILSHYFKENTMDGVSKRLSTKVTRHL